MNNLMIVLDNIIFNLQKAGGISVVWYNLIKNLLTYSDNTKYIEYPNSANIFRKDLSIPPSNILMKNYFNPMVSQFLHPKIHSSKPFIFHSSYFRTCSNPYAINVTTVHDFIYEQGKPNLKQKLRIKLNYKAIRKSDAIVCISENTKRDLFRFIPDVDPNKVYVIYNGVSEEYKPIDQEKKIPQYKDHILFVGGRQGYKNFDFVIKSLRDTPYKLVICGNSLTKEEMDLLDENLQGRYISIEFPSNEELNKIYNSVYALVYPSSYEGFGIPVLEAQRAGCPVIALNASSVPEVIGTTPLLMDEISENDLLSKLDLLKDEALRQNVIETGIANGQHFSWGKMSQEYFDLYNKLLEDRAHNRFSS